MRWNILILSIAISLVPIFSYAAVYKWIDENGDIHYSQSRPTNAQSKRMKIAPPPKEGKSTYKRPSLGKKDATDKKNGEQNPDENNQQADRKKSSNKQDPGCKTAKLALKTLLSHGRIRQKDSDGNVSYIPDDQKQQRIKQEKDFIKQNCK